MPSTQTKKKGINRYAVSLAQMCIVSLGVGIVFGPKADMLIDDIVFLPNVVKDILFYSKPLLLVVIAYPMWFLLRTALGFLIRNIEKEDSYRIQMMRRKKARSSYENVLFLDAADDDEIIDLLQSLDSERREKIIRRFVD